MRLRLLLPALAALLLSAPAFATLTVKGTQLLQDGKPFFLRGAYYIQPSAYHHCFLRELDEKALPKDFAAMRAAGLNCLAIGVNWGDFLPKIEGKPGAWQWDRAADARFRRLLSAAQREGLIVDIWFGTARVPDNTPGCHLGEPQTDELGVKHQPFTGYVFPDYPGCAQFGDDEWHAFLDYHRHVAELTKGFDNVLFDPLDWQHLNMNYWAWGNARNLAAWREWLKARNGDLAYWAGRWGEKLSSWDQVIFPVDSWVRRSAARLEGSPYAGLPDTPEGAKTKDFRAWHDMLMNQVQLAITSVLKRERPDVLIGQRVDLWHYGDFRMNTWQVGAVDLIFQGGYAEKVEQAEQPAAMIEQSVKDVTSRWRRPMPVIFWETGTNIADIPIPELERVQAMQLAGTEQTARRLGLGGWIWWTWRDYAMGPAAMRFGLVRVDGTAKPALGKLREALRGRLAGLRGHQRPAPAEPARPVPLGTHLAGGGAWLCRHARR